MSLLLDQPAAVRRPAGVVRVTGDDRIDYLHTLLSQQLEGLDAGTAADFLFLDAKGNVLAVGRALVRADDVVLLTPPELAPVLAAELEARKFLLRVEAADESAGWALASLRGRGLPAGGAPVEPMRFSDEGQALALRDRSGGVDLLGSAGWVDEQLRAAALPEADSADWEAWRVAHGEPRWGREIVAGHRAQELGLLPTHVHLRKGCYPGQESIAKTWNLGRPRRALAVVELDGEPGDSVELAGRTAKVTSAAPAGEHWLALALLPVDGEGRLPETVDEPSGRVLRRVGEGLPVPGA